MESTEEFRGSLAEVSVPMVLHRIVAERARGTLTFSSPAETIHLFFVDGELKTAATTRGGMRIGEMLLLHGVVEEAAIEDAMRSIRSGRRPRIGRILVEKGLLSRDVLDAEIRRHFEEIFFSCFAWTDGDFAFSPEAGRLDPDVALELPTAALIMEGVRRRPAPDRCREELGNPAHFVRATTLAERVESLRLDSEEAYLLSLCDGKTRLRDLIRLGSSRDEAVHTLYTLLACGLIALSPELPPGPPHEPWDTSPLLLPIDLSGANGRPDEDVRHAQARAAYLEAAAFLEKHDWYGAIVLLQDCVRLVPDNPEYHFRLAGALAHNRLWRRRALDEYREAFRLDPIRQEVMVELAEHLLVCRELSDAGAIARNLVDRYPTDRSRELLARCESAAAENANESPGTADRPAERRGNSPAPRPGRS